MANICFYHRIEIDTKISTLILNTKQFDQVGQILKYLGPLDNVLI